jgi:cold shock CspA family protein
VPSGSVKWSSPTGGAGFIQRDHGYNRVLIHILRFEVRPERVQQGKLAVRETGR